MAPIVHDTVAPAERRPTPRRPGDRRPAAHRSRGDLTETPAETPAEPAAETPAEASAEAAGPGRAGGTRTGIGAELRRLLDAGALDLPLAGSGETRRRWAALAAWGGRDLSLARLAEGHVDAVGILAEAGRTPVPGALYGVWASRSGGATVRAEHRDGAVVLAGTMRFCSGARVLDRALVVVDPPADEAGGQLLLDVDVTGPRVVPAPGSWCTAAMAAADTLDVTFDDAPVGWDAQVGAPDWYVARPGFALGGGGVAAVWWGGAAGVLDRVLGHLRAEPDPHVLAHLGELHVGLAATQALMQRTAALADGTEPGEQPADTPLAGTPVTGTRAPWPAAGAADLPLALATLRSAAERCAREVVERVPRIVGPGPLSRDADLAGALADLALYIRQHHGERDHAALGAQVLERGRSA